MAHSDDADSRPTDHADRAREDRIVAFLHARGVFGGGAHRDGRAAATAAPAGLRRWRVTIIAAAAALVIGVLSLIADRTPRPPATETPADPPALLIWY